MFTLLWLGFVVVVVDTTAIFWLWLFLNKCPKLRGVELWVLVLQFAYEGEEKTLEPILLVYEPVSRKDQFSVLAEN